MATRRAALLVGARMSEFAGKGEFGMARKAAL